MYGDRLLALGEHRAARIVFAPLTPPCLLEGLDPARAGRDGLPFLKEGFKVINDRTTNWTIVPYPTEAWARALYPGDGASANGEALRGRTAVDAGAARLGEVALVDRESRVGALDTIFMNTLLDENAASHVALGNAYAISAGEGDQDRINQSAVHIDFMIGSNDVDVTGLTRDGERVPVLRGGAWQV